MGFWAKWRAAAPTTAPPVLKYLVIWKETEARFMTVVMPEANIQVLLSGPSKEAENLLARITTETSAASYAASTLG